MTDSSQLWAEPPLTRRSACSPGPTASPSGAMPQPGTDVIDFLLHCVAHAHPDCRFRWVRVTLDLSDTVGASITDLELAG